jgi:enoyl-CoA hydratase
MPFLLLDKPRPHVTLVTLNRPERMNAMSFDVMIPFRQALEEISRDSDTRVVVVTGAGAGFCSGADLVDSGRIPDTGGLTLPGISLRAMELLDDVVLCRTRPQLPAAPRDRPLSRLRDHAHRP